MEERNRILSPSGRASVKKVHWGDSTLPHPLQLPEGGQRPQEPSRSRVWLRAKVRTWSPIPSRMRVWLWAKVRTWLPIPVDVPGLLTSLCPRGELSVRPCQARAWYWPWVSAVAADSSWTAGEPAFAPLFPCPWGPAAITAAGRRMSPRRQSMKTFFMLSSVWSGPWHLYVSWPVSGTTSARV